MQTLCFGVNIAGYGVCAKDMGGKGIEAWRGVTEEVSEGDSRERVGVGVCG